MSKEVVNMDPLVNFGAAQLATNRLQTGYKLAKNPAKLFQLNYKPTYFLNAGCNVPIIGHLELSARTLEFRKLTFQNNFSIIND